MVGDAHRGLNISRGLGSCCNYGGLIDYGSDRVTPKCVHCGKFVSVDNIHWDPEVGEFGTILSEEPWCKQCWN